MTWQQKELPSPVLDGVKSIASGIGGVTQSIEGVLETLLSLLNVAKAFFVTTTDPMSAIFQPLLTELEDLISDLFNSGIYQLYVLPNEVGNSAVENVKFKFATGIIQDPDVETIKLIAQEKSAEFNFDQFGIKLMTPSECIDHMIRSFDDLGDTARPTFSSSSQVCAMGFIVTAPSLNGFLPLLEPLGNILGIQPFLDIYSKFRDKQIAAADLPTPPSQKPDWDNSLTLATFDIMRQQRDLLLKALGLVRGYTQNADEPLKDLIDVLERKTNSLKNLVGQFNTLISQLESATKASGVYTFNYPPTGGGVSALKTALRDPQFSDINTGYTVGALFLGGGPSLNSVNTLRQLMLG